jgi:hypothetical protein
MLQRAERTRFIPRSLSEASVRYQTELHQLQFGPAWHIWERSVLKHNRVMAVQQSFYWLEAFYFRDTHTHTHTQAAHTRKCSSLVLSNISQWIIILATMYKLLSSFSQTTLAIEICIKTEAIGKIAFKMEYWKKETSEQTINFNSQFFNTVLVDRRSADQTGSPQINGPRVEHYRFDFQQRQTLH